MALKTPQEMLELYQQAEAELLEGKTISFQGRTLTHENLAEIRAGRMEWEIRVMQAQGRRRGPSVVEFCD